MSAGLELREMADGTTKFVGYAAVTQKPYEVGSFIETIARGAFKRTLSEGPDVVLLVNHDGLPLARTYAGTLELTEDELGLRVAAELDAHDPEVQTLRRKYGRGDLSGDMSFAFRVTDQEWNGDHSQRLIRSVTIHRGDVSIVTHGANDATSSMFRGVDFTPEQRAKRAEQAGTQIRGYRGGRIVAFGDVLARDLPRQREARHVRLPDYTTAAKADLFYAQERAWLAQERAKAGVNSR